MYRYIVFGVCSKLSVPRRPIDDATIFHLNTAVNRLSALLLSRPAPPARSLAPPRTWLSSIIRCQTAKFDGEV